MVIVTQAENVSSQLRDNQELFELAFTENDKETLKTIQSDTQELEKLVEEIEFKRMFSNSMEQTTVL